MSARATASRFLWLLLSEHNPATTQSDISKIGYSNGMFVLSIVTRYVGQSTPFLTTSRIPSRRLIVMKLFYLINDHDLIARREHNRITIKQFDWDKLPTSDIR